jgi:hypothetical protein
MLGLRASRDEIDDVFDSIDQDGSGSIEYHELKDLLEAEANQKEFPKSPLLARNDEDEESTGWCQRKCPRLMRCGGGTLWLLNTVTLQTILYFLFVAAFQLLTESLRMKEEYFLDRAVVDTFISNHFDSSHNTFESVRRVADIWEWSNNVLWPGLLGNAGPCDPNNIGNTPKACNDDAWPDGDGQFHLRDATPFTVPELVTRMDMFDWTEGIQLRQARVKPMPAAECASDLLGAYCYPEMKANEPSATEPFGHNWTHPASPLDHPWRYFSPKQLGSNPNGQTSANLASFRQIEAGGFVAVVLPFFSTDFLPEERGTPAQVTDFRKFRVTREAPADSPLEGDGLASLGGRRAAEAEHRTARFSCVRLSWNGEQLHQLCDPNDTVARADRTTGVVRAAIETFWSDIKRAQFIDAQTRALTLTMDVRSNHMGVRSRVTFMWELTSMGAVLPSYDMETRVEAHAHRWATRFYLNIGLGFCAFFVVLELIELAQCGPCAYFLNMWNVMDWVNFAVFFLVWWTLRTMFKQEDNRECALLCQTVGFQDDWQVLSTLRAAKIYLSLCVCIQLLKIIKFTNALVPKMGLATAVLSKGLADLVFFGLVFGISMFAFSVMFYVQLGPVMEGFNDQLASFISLARALFGDFDIDEILNNSRGYTNAVLFLTYLFVAVFIMLSMFLAILGENQAKVRGDQDDAQENGDAPPEYGIFHHAGKCLQVVGAKVLRKAREAAGDDDSTLDMAPAACEDSQTAVLEDLKGEISNMQKMFVKAFKDKAADNPKSPGGSRGGHFGGAGSLSGGFDERTLQRMAAALEQRLAPSITRAIAVELGDRESRGHGRSRQKEGELSHRGAQSKRRASQCHPHGVPPLAAGELLQAVAAGASTRTSTSTSANANVAQLISHGTKRRGSSRHILPEALSDRPLERAADWSHEQSMAC